MEIESVLASTGQWTAENEEGEAVGTGSCWAVAPDLVVTNYHVASMGPRATVAFSDSSLTVVGLVAADKPRDLAIAKVRLAAKGALRPLECSTTSPAVGQEVYAVGSPLGIGQTLSRGIVSAVRTATDVERLGWKARRGDEFIQVDAAISNGSSGGPVIDTRSLVVAVSTAIVTGGQALNLCVPARYVIDLLDVRDECRPLRCFAPMTSASSARQATVPQSLDARSDPDGDQIFLERVAGFVQANVEEVTALYCSAMHADGRVSPDEFQTFVTQFQVFGIDAEQLKHALATYNDEVATLGQDVVLDACLEVLKVMGSPEERKELLAFLGIVILGDGYAPQEAEWMCRVLNTWGDIRLP